MSWARFTDRTLSILKSNIDTLAPLYSRTEPPADGWGGFQIEFDFNDILHLEAGQVNLLLGGHENDLANARRLYSSLRDIPRSLAVDENFWAYLAHGPFWTYMRSRWSDSITPRTIRDRYFFSGPQHRALVHQGIARLWWYAHVTYDETRQDPFELTGVLLRRIRVAQALLERSWSSNPDVLKGFLIGMDRAEREFSGAFPVQDVLRDDVPVYINQIGGVTILDHLEAEAIAELVYQRIQGHTR